ncbi:UbiX family flavin prenyltransferase [Romboutsia sp.]|uniref:UbiX family flavin prenyltransferase n=1 Tax=Romboutsia sp. TaxID=1965302 RepID=UPI003F3A9935
MKIIVGISGGSGAIYALGILKALKDLNIETHLVVSTMGEYVVNHECGVNLEELKEMADCFYENYDLAAAISSGSFKTDGMIIAPCSMKTLAAIAHGYSDSLLTRAADVCIKDKRRLVLLPRETPLSSIHLENMLKLSNLGVTIMPPTPGFYNHPQDLSDIVSSIVGRSLDQLNVEHDLIKRWGE